MTGTEAFDKLLTIAPFTPAERRALQHPTVRPVVIEALEHRLHVDSGGDQVAAFVRAHVAGRLSDELESALTKIDARVPATS